MRWSAVTSYASLISAMRSAVVLTGRNRERGTFNPSEFSKHFMAAPAAVSRCSIFRTMFALPHPADAVKKIGERLQAAPSSCPSASVLPSGRHASAVIGDAMPAEEDEAPGLRECFPEEEEEEEGPFPPVALATVKSFCTVLLLCPRRSTTRRSSCVETARRSCLGQCRAARTAERHR